MNHVEKSAANRFECVESLYVDLFWSKSEVKVTTDTVMVDLRDSITELMKLYVAQLHFFIPEFCYSGE